MRDGSWPSELIALATPAAFFAIGRFDDDFSQTSDAEVVACLGRASSERR